LLPLAFLCRFRHCNAGACAGPSREYVRVFPQTSFVWNRCARR
jgi:hypothetical protein